jgi:Cys-tRNA(Pro) deacylase
LASFVDPDRLLTSLPKGAQGVQRFLITRNCDALISMLPDSAATARDAAAALGIPVRQIGKSVVFGSDQGVLVAVVCGDQKVDVNLLAQELQATNVHPLRAAEIKLHTGYVIGGVSPFGLPAEIKIVIDRHLLTLSEFYVAAGHPQAVVRTDGRELVALTGAMVAPVACDS